MGPPAVSKPLVDMAIFHRIRAAVDSGMVDQEVHVFSDQIFRTPVPQQPHTGRVCKCAISGQIEPVDGLRGRIEQEPDLPFAFPQGFGFLAESSVLV